MDSITHIALGACIGEVMLGKYLGKKALWWGALAQSFPDIDFIASFILPQTDDLLAHRGLTHSILFAIPAGFILAIITDWLHRPHESSLKKFLLFFWMQIILHDLLDTCNAYGTGLLEPFSHKRFAIDILYVADPLFSIWIGIAAAMLIILRRSHPARKKWLMFGLIPATLYFPITAINKISVDNNIKRSLAQKNIHYTDYFTTPTPFNSMLWYAVANTDSGYYIGYRSVFDDKDRPTGFTFFYRNEHLLQNVESTEDLKKLKRFADRYYTVEKWNDTLVFNVLRFGQMLGWQHPKARFAFHYYLNPRFDNTLVVQRGRFEGWNRRTLLIMWRRILGSIEE
jgi:inner membrane protein